MATARLRRKPSRMALSPNVAKATLKPKKISRDLAGPFAGMNRTHVEIREEDRAKLQAKNSDKKESPLYKALKMQTALAPVTYRHRNAVKEKIADITSFNYFALLPVVRDSIFSQALPGLVDVTPSPIQRLAIPALLETDVKKKKKPSKKADEDEHRYDQFLLAAETGSGKTLAYLVPVIDAVKRLEMAEKEEEAKLEQEKAEEKEKKMQNKAFDIEPPELSAPHETAGRPRAVILLPTSELVNQVGKMVKAFSHTVKYRSGMIHSGYTARKIRNIVFNPNGIDILVATPHLLASIAKNDPNILSRVTHLVVDEADSLLDRSFSPATTELIDKSAPSLKQLILCSATIPRSLDSLLRKRYPDIRRLTTPNLHAIPRRVQLGVVDIEKDPYRGNRSLACADVIWSIGKAGDSSEPSAGPYSSMLGPKVKKIIVFVNEREDAEKVANFLNSKGIDAACLSRDSDDRRQEEILSEFTITPPPPSPEDIMLAQKKRRLEDSIPFELPERKQEQQGPTRRLPNTKVLVTTDLGSRGIDTLAVKTVILYHVPHTTIDFIHRLGRVGRMGKRGRGVVLVGKKDRKDIVKEVREGMFRGQALI